MTAPDEQRLEDLLAAALCILEERGADALQSFLEEHPADASHLRAALSDLQQFDMLEPPTAGMPERFDEYVVKRQLGTGGMGVVYLAEQQSLRREVAIKAIRPELLLFDGSRERFRREIDAVARLEHPAIVPILATGSAHGVPYYVMPRLRGHTGEAVLAAFKGRDARGLRGADLRELLGAERGDTDSAANDVFGGSYWQAIVRLIRQAALGIHHAHNRGVLHRDLKPSNIMFSPDGQATVLDFGLALARGDARMTRTGAAAGSPAYMSPEQLRGDVADERSDVYGLAATLHCLLGLRPPFPTESTEVLRSRILAGEPRSLRNRTDAPPELLLVLDCALDLDRTHRYASAQAFADDLGAVLEGREIAARRLPLRVRARRFVQRHSAISAAAAVALGFLAVLPLLLLWQQREAGEVLAAQADKTRTANKQLAATNERLADQVRRAEESRRITLDAIAKLLTGIQTHKLRNQVGAQKVAAELLREALKLFADLERREPDWERLTALELSTMDQLIGIESDMGHRDESERLIDRGLQLLEHFPQTAAMRMHRARFQLRKAAACNNRGAHDGVPELVTSARALLEQLIDEGITDWGTFVRLSDAHQMSAHLAEQDEDFAVAERELRAAIAAGDRCRQASGAPTSWMRSRLAYAKFLRRRERFDDGLAEVDSLIAALDGLTAEQHPTWPVPPLVAARALREKHQLHNRGGDPDAAAAALRQAIPIYDELIPTYQDIASLRVERGAARCNLAVLLANGERYDDAIPLARAAIEDQLAALRKVPGIRNARDFLMKHRLLLTICLRETGRWPELEREAIAFARMRLPASWLESAAWDLLRCAQHAATPRDDELRDLAFRWLHACREQGYALRLDRADYDPIRADPRFAELR
ncbi:MAG: serine/threonine protein kinase [Planctomycetes bacterium]|nr:serine/threonine protein kinase [Planctomycetota bacterium]